MLRHQDMLDPVVFKRCKYVVEENKRVLQSCHDLENDNLESFGQRMYQSHSGLQIEYEVSCRELDTLVDVARNLKGVLGARMMGGGFGGCTINLVVEEHLDSFTGQIREKYAEALGREIEVYRTTVSEGTHLLSEAEVDI